MTLRVTALYIESHYAHNRVSLIRYAECRYTECRGAEAAQLVEQLTTEHNIKGSNPAASRHRRSREKF